MNDLLLTIVKNLVDKTDEVTVTEVEVRSPDTIMFEVRVAQDEMGKVIGKQGSIAKAVRLVMKAAAIKENKRVIVDIVG